MNMAVLYFHVQNGFDPWLILITYFIRVIVISISGKHDATEISKLTMFFSRQDFCTFHRFCNNIFIFSGGKRDTENKKGKGE